MVSASIESAFDGTGPEADAAAGYDVTQIVKPKRGLVSAAQNPNARDVRWSEISGRDCTSRCSSYVGEPTLVLKNTAQLAWTTPLLDGIPRAGFSQKPVAILTVKVSLDYK